MKFTKLTLTYIAWWSWSGCSSQKWNILVLENNAEISAALHTLHQSQNIQDSSKKTLARIHDTTSQVTSALVPPSRSLIAPYARHGKHPLWRQLLLILTNANGELATIEKIILFDNLLDSISFVKNSMYRYQCLPNTTATFALSSCCVCPIFNARRLPGWCHYDITFNRLGARLRPWFFAAVGDLSAPAILPLTANVCVSDIWHFSLACPIPHLSFSCRQLFKQFNIQNEFVYDF